MVTTCELGCLFNVGVAELLPNMVISNDNDSIFVFVGHKIINWKHAIIGIQKLLLTSALLLFTVRLISTSILVYKFYWSYIPIFLKSRLFGLYGIDFYICLIINPLKW